jgi:predicted RNA-binding Zn-ribbon protein involved in translation (DUF1610 family)
MDKMEFDSVNGVHCTEENGSVIEKCPFCGDEHIVKNGKKYNRPLVKLRFSFFELFDN